MKKLSRNKKIWLSLVIGFGFAVLIVAWYFLIGIQAFNGGSYYNKGENAIWLGHEWAQEPKSDFEIYLLVDSLSSRDISNLYVHCGPIGVDGRIDPARYHQILNFVEKVKIKDPSMNVYAWLGQVRNKLDLSDVRIRRNIINTSMLFTEVADMEGIHFDIEPVWDEDKDFILLLKEASERFGSDKKISVALAEFIPNSVIWFTENIAEFENYNTEMNYLNVAKYADQIVVMVYDTGIDSRFLYKWLVKEQVVWLTSLFEDEYGEMEGAAPELLIGLPAYDEEKDGFDPFVENVGTGMAGLISGLNDIRSEDQYFTGVALYARWEMDPEEWRIYKALWQ